MATIEDAKARGYENACRIKAAHVLKEVRIPPHAKIMHNPHTGSIYFQNPSGTCGMQSPDGRLVWEGIIYEGSTGRWAEILEFREIEIGRYIKVLRKTLGGQAAKYKIGDYLRIEDKPSTHCYRVEHAGLLDLTSPTSNRITIGDVELMPKGFVPIGGKVFSTLRDFPEGGVCWKPTAELLDYLREKMPNGQRPSISNNSLENRGLAWNKGGCWLVQHTSGQPEYDITQLLPFLIPDREKSALDTLPDHLKDYPLTPEECYNIGPGNTVRVVNPGHPSHGIVGIVGEIAMGSSTKKLEVHFKQPLPPMTGGGRLVAVPLEKVQLIPDLPKDKWAIQITPENIDILDLFMKGRRHEWKEYRDGWALHVGSYFHYPPYCVHAHSSTKRETSYNLVTLKEIEHIILVDRDPVKEKEQVIINNLNLKEDGKRDSENREVIKVQRPNLSIRRDSTIREIGFRCPKSQIRIGTLDSEDQARFSAS